MFSSHLGIVVSLRWLFYEPISYEVDGILKDREELIKLGYFRTDKNGMSQN